VVQSGAPDEPAAPVTTTALLDRTLLPTVPAAL
jgi:hypothetical protein